MTISFELYFEIILFIFKAFFLIFDENVSEYNLSKFIFFFLIPTLFFRKIIKFSGVSKFLNIEKLWFFDITSKLFEEK